jgi:Fe-S oxidoreductase
VSSSAGVITIPVRTKSRTSKVGTAIRELLLHAVAQDRVLQKAYPGIMHLLIFWGVVIQGLGTIVNLLQNDLFLPFELTIFPRGQAYLWFELIMDLAGGMILLGVLMAVFRRAVLRPASVHTRWDDTLALAILTLIPLLGFTSEAVRLESVDPAWRAWSPIGNLFSQGLRLAGLTGAAVAPVHQIVFWGHVVTGLGLVVLIPFTKLRHLVTAPLNILARPKRPVGALETIQDIETTEKLGVGKIEEFPTPTLISLDACVQCGRCEASCPAAISGMHFSPREIVFALRETMHSDLASSNGKAPVELVGGAIAAETPWLCTTCGACQSACPVFIDPVAMAVDLRRYLTLTTGQVPGSVGEALTQMERRGNPWGLPKENHAPWLNELGVRVLHPGEEVDVLLFLGCAYGYDTRSAQAGKALVQLLQSARVDFAVLGAAEGCCGETARRLGNEYVYQVMAKENVATLQSVRFRRIVSPCAHCYNTLKNEYPQFGGSFRVQHHSELLAELAAGGQLVPKANANGHRYTYHDSCYLGRYNEIYDQPRELLKTVPGLQTAEMARRRRDGFCCGGGGGQMWMETDPNTRINHRRLQEAMEMAKADVVVTACPYCLIMMDDAIRSKGVGETVQVKDLAEVIRAHLSV